MRVVPCQGAGLLIVPDHRAGRSSVPPLPRVLPPPMTAVDVLITVSCASSAFTPRNRHEALRDHPSRSGSVVLGNDTDVECRPWSGQVAPCFFEIRRYVAATFSQ